MSGQCSSFHPSSRICPPESVQLNYFFRQPEEVLSQHEDIALVYIETPSNPLLNITDIARCVEAVRGRNILIAADNTFASPFFQRPLALGADIVVEACTKYIGGHSDVVGGIVCVNKRP